MDEKALRLKEIIERRVGLFKRKPEAAIYKPSATSRHISGLLTESKAREHTVISDYAEPAGGTNTAPNPIELLLCAFAACIEAAFYEFAAHQGLEITSVTAEVYGELDLRGMFMVDESVKAGFQNLTYKLIIETPDDVQKVRALADKVLCACPVVDSLTRPVNVTGEVIINA